MDGAPHHVILLHGLARSSASMLAMQAMLTRAGYRVRNIGYPSRRASIETLVGSTLPAALAACDDAPVHFVTHSMGGILVRQYLANTRPAHLGQTVMLAPPNHGSELVDTFGDLAAFGWFNGPAGVQLGTDGLPSDLGAVDFPLGIIAGTRSFNPVTAAIIGQANDGKVSVESTRVEGMEAHLALPVTHTFMMNNPLVLAQTLHFLRCRRFADAMTTADAVRVLVKPERIGVEC